MQVKAAVASSRAPSSASSPSNWTSPGPTRSGHIAAVGVCHTDIIARDGGMPFSLPAVLGHEGAGTVEAVGEAVTKVRPGDRVAITFRSCGVCERCRSGDAAYCYSMLAMNYAGQRLDGSKAIRQDETPVSSNFFGQSSFATHALTYERNGEAAGRPAVRAGRAAWVQGADRGRRVIRAFAARAGSSIVITGAGAVGLSAVMGAVIRACGTVIVVEPHTARRALALELGATDVIDPAEQPELPAAVRAIAPHGVDYALDTTGRPEILSALMGCLAPKGVLGVVGVPPRGAPMPGDLGMVLALGQTVRGIIEGDSDPDVFLPELVEHWRAGRLPLEKLVRTFPFAEINAAIEAQHHGDCVKVVLTL